MKLGGKLRQIARTVLLMVLTSACSSSSRAFTQGEDITPYGTLEARLDGDRVVLRTGDRFRIPQSWLRWNQEYANNLHLTRGQLRAVRTGEGEWDREYAEVVNAVLPFDSCAAHVGSEGWGRRSVSYGDLQARLYVGAFDEDEVRAAVIARGVPTGEGFFLPVQVDTGHVGTWMKTRLQWNAFYGDYGGKANVEFLTRRGPGRVAVWVLMYSFPPRSAERAALLESFEWDG